LASNKADYLMGKNAASNKVGIAKNNFAIAEQNLNNTTKKVKECEGGVTNAVAALERKKNGSKSTKSIPECEAGVKNAERALETAKEFVESAKEALEMAKENVKRAEEVFNSYVLEDMYRIELTSNTKPSYIATFNNSSDAYKSRNGNPHIQVLDKSDYECDPLNRENSRMKKGSERFETWMILPPKTIMVDTDSRIGEGDIIITDFVSLSKKTTVIYEGYSYTIVSKLPVKFYGDIMVEAGNNIYLV
jgi:hypothetical protein